MLWSTVLKYVSPSIPEDGSDALVKRFNGVNIFLDI